MKVATVCALAIVYVYINGLVQETHAICTLDQMKRYAIEACEHLFRNDGGVRDKRSFKHNDIWDGEFARFGNKRHYVRRGNYPIGGFLKMDHFHYNKLAEVDVYPRYKAHKLHHILNPHKSHTTHGDRIKRAHSPYYNNIPYCCLQNCEEDFFC